jgi:hypothetical protein
MFSKDVIEELTLLVDARMKAISSRRIEIKSTKSFSMFSFHDVSVDSERHLDALSVAELRSSRDAGKPYYSV